MPVWLLKLIAEFAIKFLLGKIGHSATVEHVQAVFTKYTPLTVDPDPSPASQRGSIEGHFGGL